MAHQDAGQATAEGIEQVGRFNDRIRQFREAGGVSAVLLPVGAFVAFILIWQWVTTNGMVNENIVPPPTEIVQAFGDILGESFFWEAAWVTAKEALIGFVVGVVGAYIIGTLIGLFRTFSLALYPLVVFFQIIPRVALAPVFLTWFGFGITSKWLMAATICFFPVLVNVILGLEGVQKEARSLMRSFGASRWVEYRKLLLPASLSAIFASLKVAVALSLIGAIVAEFIGASDGLGVLIREFSFQLLIPESFAVLVALSMMGLVFFAATTLLERRVVFWRGH
jgi:NitT/TauT family transport system permease protein